MCHQSVGLVTNLLEGHGISTIMICLKPDVIQGTGCPRAVTLRFPMGTPCGQPDQPAQQRRIVRSVLEVLPQLTEPGQMPHLPYRWRRMKD